MRRANWFDEIPIVRSILVEARSFENQTSWQLKQADTNQPANGSCRSVHRLKSNCDPKRLARQLE